MSKVRYLNFIIFSTENSDSFKAFFLVDLDKVSEANEQ